jgi:hypothetical protein
MLLTQAAIVLPAKAGIQILRGFLDPGFRRGDVKSITVRECPSELWIQGLPPDDACKTGVAVR